MAGWLVGLLLWPLKMFWPRSAVPVGRHAYEAARFLRHAHIRNVSEHLLQNVARRTRVICNPYRGRFGDCAATIALIRQRSRDIR
jgi:hypothetical protein